eukprot:SAG31_NODE_5584_length_2442_cov_3.322663_1_plen_71_part_10
MHIQLCAGRSADWLELNVVKHNVISCSASTSPAERGPFDVPGVERHDIVVGVMVLPIALFRCAVKRETDRP